MTFSHQEERNSFMSFIPSSADSSEPTPSRHQQRAYSVTAMPSELQKMRQQEEEHQEKKRNQPWWQYYYQLYHYQLPPGRKPTVFGPYLLLQTLGEGEFGKVKFGIEIKSGQEVAFWHLFLSPLVMYIHTIVGSYQIDQKGKYRFIITYD